MIEALCDRGRTLNVGSGIEPSRMLWIRCGISHSRGGGRWLVSEIETLKPFPDVLAAREKLRSK